MPRTLSAWSEHHARVIIDAHAGREGPLLPILHALQEAFGHVPKPAISLLAETLNLSQAEVYGVVTFYHDFREAPAGRHVLNLCRGEACQSRGSEALAETCLAALDIDWHRTTQDGEFTVEPVYCLGLCSCGPSALLDGAPLAALDAGRLAAAIDEVRGL